MFQKFFGKMVRIKETSFLSTRGMILIIGNCMYLGFALTAVVRLGSEGDPK